MCPTFVRNLVLYYYFLEELHMYSNSGIQLISIGLRIDIISIFNIASYYKQTVLLFYVLMLNKFTSKYGRILLLRLKYCTPTRFGQFWLNKKLQIFQIQFNSVLVEFVFF